MVLKVLLGRARSGKSAWVLQRIKQTGDAAQSVLIVPEHASHAAELDLCRACGDGASRFAEVLTFKLLASRVLSLTGGSADVTLDNGGKLLLLQRVLQRLSSSLAVYRRPSRRSAFLQSLLGVMEELQAYAVDPQKLIEAAQQIPGDGGLRLHDTALIYAAYMADLTADGRDSRDRLEKLEQQLEDSHYIDGKDVYLDGFSYFTARECNILRIMLRRARSVTVTVLGDSRDRELFAESVRLRERLFALCRELGAAYDEQELAPNSGTDELSHLERCFFGEARRYEGASGKIRIFEAVNLREECEWAASEILRLVREEGCRFRDIAVTARNLSAVEDILCSVFARYGIPVFAARRSAVLDQSVTALLLGALRAVSGGFEYEDVFSCLKTGLAGLSEEETDRLENYVLKWDIHGSMWLRETPWTGHPEGYGIEWDAVAEEELATVNALRERVRAAFVLLHEGVKGMGAAEQKMRALYAFLEHIRLPEALEERTRDLFARGEGKRAEELSQLWNLLCGVMDQFVDILGDSELDAEEFARLVHLVLSQYSIGTIPVSLDQVKLSEMTSNDRHSAKVLFLIGANDHVLPTVTSGAGLLKDEDRAALEAHDISLSPYGMQQLQLEMQNLYAALAQPTQRLYVSYPVFEEGGTQLRPSFAVGRILTLFPQIKVERKDADKDFRLSAIRPALDCAAEEIGGEVWQYFVNRGDFDSQLRAMETASHYARGKLSHDAVRALYGENITLSASKMDKARSCHFAYFMQYGLKAKERKAAGFDAPQTGTFVHDVLENTLKRAREQGGLKKLSAQHVRTIVHEAIAEYMARELPDFSEKNARFRYLFNRLCQKTYQIVEDVVRELSVSDFEPVAFELGFGAGGELPAVTLKEGGSEVRVVGKVDRVDGWLRDGKLYLRVVDYKTGKKSFDLAELRYGLGIQMLLYLFALQKEGKAYFGEEIVPAGVLYTPSQTPILRTERGIDEQTLKKEMQKTLRRSGLLLSEPEVLCAMEHSALEAPNYLPLQVKKEGELVGNLASAQQLGKLALYVEKLVREIAREMNEGNVSADPWTRGADDNACRFCAFRSACHFTDGRGGDRAEYIRKTTAAELWQHIDSELEKEGENG